jgi:hypothetical protein
MVDCGEEGGGVKKHKSGSHARVRPPYKDSFGFTRDHIWAQKHTVNIRDLVYMRLLPFLRSFKSTPNETNFADKRP